MRRPKTLTSVMSSPSGSEPSGIAMATRFAVRSSRSECSRITPVQPRRRTVIGEHQDDLVASARRLDPVDRRQREQIEVVDLTRVPCPVLGPGQGRSLDGPARPDHRRDRTSLRIRTIGSCGLGICAKTSRGRSVAWLATSATASRFAVTRDRNWSARRSGANASMSGRSSVDDRDQLQLVDLTRVDEPVDGPVRHHLEAGPDGDRLVAGGAEAGECLFPPMRRRVRRSHRASMGPASPRGVAC